MVADNPKLTPPKSPPRRAPQSAAPAPGRRTVTAVKPTRRTAERIVIYGPGGIGKTTLAASAPGPVWFFDLDESLGVIELPNDGVHVVPDVTTWADLRAALQGDGWDGVKTIVIDSATKAEELAVEWTIENVPHEKGNRIRRLEDYGYGKGYQHVYETFLCLLGDLDQHVRAGRNVVLVCHDCTTTVPNPQGDDYLRYEPRLQSPASGKGSIRLRAREWADHLLFIGYDIAAEDGKGQMSGSRTIYPNETAFCMAKSRTLDMPVEYVRYDDALWRAIFKTE